MSCYIDDSPRFNPPTPEYLLSNLAVNPMHKMNNLITFKEVSAGAGTYEYTVKWMDTERKRTREKTESQKYISC